MEVILCITARQWCYWLDVVLGLFKAIEGLTRGTEALETGGRTGWDPRYCCTNLVYNQTGSLSRQTEKRKKDTGGVRTGDLPRTVSEKFLTRPADVSVGKMRGLSSESAPRMNSLHQRVECLSNWLQAEIIAIQRCLRLCVGEYLILR